MRGQRRQHRFLDLHAVKGPLGERVYATVDADGRRCPGDEQQITAATRGEQAQPGLEACQITDTRRRAGRVQFEDQSVDVVVVRHHVWPGGGTAWTAFYLKRATAMFR
jgi:hypothetical protein